MSEEKVVKLSPWDMLTRSSTSRSRSHELLNREDADSAIRSLSPLEVYYTMKGLGPADSIPYLAVIEEDQIKTLVDVDVWNRDEFEIADLFVWFEAFREAGLPALQRAARSMDPEALALLLRRRLHIAMVTEDDVEDPPAWVQNPSPDIAPIVKTPDSRFFIAARSVDEKTEYEGPGENLDEEDRKAILQLIDDLYRDEDFEFISSALRLAESGLSSHFEEEGFRFRNARLEDLGFPPFERAIEAFSRVNIDELLTRAEHPERNSGAMRLPAFHAKNVSDGYFVELMRSIADPVLVRAIEAELVPLANAVLVAERVAINNLDAVRDCLVLIRHYLELAVTYDNHGPSRDQLAQERLERLDLKTLFRIGYTSALGVKRRLARIEPRLLREDDRALWEASQGRRPMIVDYERALQLVQLWDDARAIDVSVIDEEDVLPPAGEQSLLVLVMTLATRIMAFDDDRFEPFTSDELVRITQLVKDLKFPQERITKALTYFEGVWRQQIEEGFIALAEELAPHGERQRIDPRFVDGVLRRLES
ncbi:MAG: DUF6178 family protein [Myxococcota bacterium]|nr:DUF6178 family protein [Myxococcota bacterium]